MRRRVLAIGGGIAVLAVGAAAFAYVSARDDSTPVSVGDVVSDFRDGDRPGEGEAGVYVYATEGFERVGGTLSARHDYPRTTTVTVTDIPCGVRERWDALAERHYVTETCIGGGRLRVRAVEDFHEFFGQERRVAVECAGGALPAPRRMEGGERWTSRCRSDAGDRLAVRGRVVRLVDVDVAGEAVPAVQIRIHGTIDGDAVRGHSVTDLWQRRADGLLLRRVVNADLTVDTPIGDAPFRERYDIVLSSLRPRR